MEEERQAAREQEPKLTAGQEFVKKLRPLGCVLFLLMSVMATVLCFTAGRNPIPGYQPPERASYENDLGRLADVLEEQVFPELPEYDMTARVTGDTVTVTIDEDHFAVGRSAILRYFPEDLITFERG